MSLPDWSEEPIAKKHDRAAFDCGEPALNEFLRRHARQSHDKGAAKTFLAIDQGPIILMIENHRTGLLWKLFMRIPEIQVGLRKLGFSSPHLGAV